LHEAFAVFGQTGRGAVGNLAGVPRDGLRRLKDLT
jgi:hypothetical protein